MRPRTNFQLARIFGIRVGVGVSWFVVLFLFIFIITPVFHKQLGGSSSTAYLLAVASVLSFFGSVLLHELGHALAARRSGLQVAGIDLWALGGITRTEESKDPGTEFRVAAAGPAVTLLIVGASILAGVLVSPNGHFFDVAIGEDVAATPALVWLSWLTSINVLVLVFNLVPAFPLDGGRIAHAAIWWRTGDRNRATHATGRAGQGFALLLGALGLFWLASGAGTAGVWSLLLAYMLYQAAGAAVVQGVLGRRIQSITVADIMDREPVTIPASATLLDAHEQFFLRYQWPWFAVVDPGHHFLGVVAATRVDAEISAGRPALPVVDVLEEDMHVRIDEGEPLEKLLGSEGLGRLGAMVAVDAEGVLQGVVTLAEVRKALRVAT
jgi:Zn-dependent protease